MTRPDKWDLALATVWAAPWIALCVLFALGGEWGGVAVTSVPLAFLFLIFRRGGYYDVPGEQTTLTDSDQWGGDGA